jgi:manganese/zinc/iron transport system substrate-binding protein
MRLLWVILAAIFVCAPGCRKAADVGGQPGDYRAVATVGMVKDLVTNIAREKARVDSLMGAGVDPHLYKPTRDDVARLIRADIVFYNGLYLEGKMVDVLEKIGQRKPVHAAAGDLDPAYLLHPQGQQAHPDPHVWMDVSAWAKAARAVEESLSRFDPPNAEFYRSNAAGYIQQLEELDSYGKRVMATIPEEKRILISSHDAFNYFGRSYQIQVMGVQGLSTESEAGLRRINELVGLIAEREIRAVFVESSVPRKSIEALIAGVHARGGELQIGGELFTDAMGEAGTYEGTYIGMMDHNLTTVARALGGEAPERGMNGRLGHGRE